MDIWISEDFYFYFEETKFFSSFISCAFDRFCLVDSKSVFEICLFSGRKTNNITRTVATATDTAQHGDTRMD